MKIKICGLKSLKDVDIVNKYLPDYAGFIFYPKSKRFLTPEKAKNLKSNLDLNIKTVGVFVDSDYKTIKSLIDNKIIDVVQLHGNEDQNLINKLKDLNVPVVKAIRIKDKNSISTVNNYNPDFFLFDIYHEDYGGTGKSFNWNLLEDLEIDKPYFLAGGINTNNIKEALDSKAFALDVSSGVETDGNKDETKVKEIIDNVRKFNGN